MVAGLPLYAMADDPGNAKLCHRLDAKSVTDDDLRFLQQIGLEWVRLEFGEGDITLDTLRAAQQRFSSGTSPRCHCQ